MQTIFDDPAFFAGYAALREAESGLNAALEQPAFERLLPPLEGARILDIGCGFGDFARSARRRGAASVVGIDPSARMIEAALGRTDDPDIRYLTLPVEEFDFSGVSFDLIASSLALHYVEDFAGLAHRIAAALAPGGRFAFSVEHPICTAIGDGGWAMGADGGKLHWPVDRYRDEGLRRSRWFVDGVVKYHRTVASYLNALVGAGLSIRRVEEPEATAEAVAARPDLADQRRRPPFLLVAADR
jgi:SAM-dependent methyltransferase